MLVFEERGKQEYPEKNLSQKNSNPHLTPGPGIKLVTHWWEASALTTAPLTDAPHGCIISLINYMKIVNSLQCFGNIFQTTYQL